jgi:phosphoglycerol transferase
MESTLPLARHRPRLLSAILWTALLLGVPLALAVYVLKFYSWDLSVPLIYGDTDHIWQLALNKVLYETGWVLTNPFLGAPEVASWHHNASAQTSALHSVLMLALSPFVDDPVRLQQIYYLLNFPLICLTSFVACRLLGISRLPAFCVGLLFSFTKFRIDEMLYSYLPNYFVVPLALVPVIWILSGRFSAFFKEPEASGDWRSSTVRLLKSREFALGLVFVLLMGVSDGYYAFFTLLLLGFAASARVLLGDWRRPLSLLPAATYILALMAAALLLQLPLHNYKKAHRSEFYPSGIKDPVLIKHPFEAEIYSSSLKLLLAPNEHHRIESLAALGKQVLRTSNEARRYPRSNFWPLGVLGSLLFVLALTLIAVPALREKLLRRPASDSERVSTSIPAPAFSDALLSLTFFIFLGSISGGIGTLVALVFPTIRAYDRFPIFLVLVLYIGAAWFVTSKLRGAARVERAGWTMLACLVTVVALYDQIPGDAYKGDESVKAKFLAERKFVHTLETSLPPQAMVYQYPYSQYLRESKSYGWGSFAHIRLYLHSHQLRWSNGGAKNSPADDWNYRVSQLPLNYLINEVEAVGFAGFVIDRTVVKPAEYEDVRRTFTSRGYKMVEDAPSNFSFVQLRDPGFRLVYDITYREADRIEITDPARITERTLPRLVEGEALMRYLSTHAGKFSGAIKKADHPEIFADGAVEIRGSGQITISPASDMRGRLNCERETGHTPGVADTLVLTLTNKSRFDWRLNLGAFPIRIGVHIRQPDGKVLRFDDGFRVPTEAYIRRGDSHTIRVPFNTLPVPPEMRSNGPLLAEFALLQEGYAWFNDINCAVPLP